LRLEGMVADKLHIIFDLRKKFFHRTTVIHQPLEHHPRKQERIGFSLQEKSRQGYLAEFALIDKDPLAL